MLYCLKRDIIQPSLDNQTTKGHDIVKLAEEPHDVLAVMTSFSTTKKSFNASTIYINVKIV